MRTLTRGFHAVNFRLEGFLCNVCIVVDIILLYFSFFMWLWWDSNIRDAAKHQVKDVLLYFHADATFTKPRTFYFPLEIQNMS